MQSFKEGPSPVPWEKELVRVWGQREGRPGHSWEGGRGWRWGWAEAPSGYRYECLGGGRSGQACGRPRSGRVSSRPRRDSSSFGPRRLPSRLSGAQRDSAGGSPSLRGAGGDSPVWSSGSRKRKRSAALPGRQRYWRRRSWRSLRRPLERRRREESQPASVSVCGRGGDVATLPWAPPAAPRRPAALT